MKLLILGGTVFLGRHIVAAALERGHEVTIFSRGMSTPKGEIAGVEHLIGNRDGNLVSLSDRTWDSVIDTSGYVPRIVSQSVELLKHAAPHYTFISSISVYSDMSMPGVHEDSPMLELEDKDSEEIAKYYGELKALCEQVVQDTYGNGALIIRPGLIVGPYDKSDRFTYWPVRVAKGGQVLAPGSPNRLIQVIHAADLAEWTVRMVEQKASGVFNATGPNPSLTMGELLEACKHVSNSDAEFVFMPDDFLKAHDVGEWMELPLWIANESMRGMMQANIDKALQHGLKFRPIEVTIRDTLDWNASRPSDTPWRAGLQADKEASVLSAWKQRSESAEA